MTNPDSLERIPVSELRFDRRNPRLAEYGITERTKEDEIISILRDAMDVQELVQSIVASGYFEQEPLIVTKEKRNFIVIEGNRRLAVVRVILVSRKSLAMEKGIDPRFPSRTSGRRVQPQAIMALSRFQARQRSGEIGQLRESEIYCRSSQGVRYTP